MNNQITFNQAMLIVGVGATGSYLGYHYGTFSKKVAVGIGLGVSAVALVAYEFENLSQSLPWIIGGGLVIAAGVMLL